MAVSEDLLTGRAKGKQKLYLLDDYGRIDAVSIRASIVDQLDIIQVKFCQRVDSVDCKLHRFSRAFDSTNQIIRRYVTLC